MNKTALFVLSAVVGLSFSMSALAAHDLKPHHKSVSCEACHAESNPTAPTKTDCSGCHGSPEDVAKKTEGKYRKYYNPHNSLHYATYADCVACHREHEASRLDCTNSNCHREFKYPVP